MYFGFEHITVSYGKHTVLRDVTMDVPQGKITVLIGRNGCGKSSLLKTVSRAVTPRSGRVILRDRPLDAYSPKERARQIEQQAMKKLKELGAGLGLEDFLNG